jgi:two-component system heavy metal sensor histidine kinase CusS
VALTRPRSNEEYGSLLTDVMEECARLSHLVSRLLILAEGDAGRLVPREHITRLDKIIHESIDMFQPVAEAKGLHLELKDLAAAKVPGEDIHLRQVVRNLLDNAIKFTPSPGKISVSLSVDSARRRTHLQVADTGQGIPPDVMPRIFDRFFRGDRARPREGARGGYGLGLSICQSIVHALQGDIEVASQPGHGATFTVSLPLAE